MTKTLSSFIVMLGLAFSFTAMQAQSSVFARIAADPDLQEFEEAIIEAGLQSTFSTNGAYTIFAPTNDVFNIPGSFNEAQIREVVLRHCVAGFYRVFDLVDGFALNTMNQRMLTVDINGNGIFIAGNRVSRPDILGSNGVLHVLDSSIGLNETFVTTVLSLINNSTKHIVLSTVIDNAGLTDMYTGPGPITVFAPNDDAFYDLSDEQFDRFFGPNVNYIRNVLMTYIVDALIETNDFNNGGSFTAQNGQILNVTVNINGTFINNIKVGFAGLRASNGMVYVINKISFPPTLPDMTIADIVMESDDHDILENLINASGLVTTLDDDDEELTFFAPTDAAFGALEPGLLDELFDDPQGSLLGVLLNHLVDEKKYTEAFLDDELTLAVNGFELNVDREMGAILINESARIIVENIEADNGLVQVIDAVLIEEEEPFTIRDYLATAPDVMNFNDYVIKSRLDSLLDTEGPFTVFAPTNSARALLRLEVREEIDSVDISLVIDFISNHIVNGFYPTPELPDTLTLTAIDGFIIDVSVDSDGRIFLNDSEIIVENIQTDNGIVHLIDTALYPVSEPNTIYEYVAQNDNHSILHSAIQKAELVFLYESPGPLTLFAPTNTAFDLLGPEMLDEFFSGPASDLVDVLLGHTLNDELFLIELLAANEVLNANGQELNITLIGNDIFVNNARIEISDIVLDNGIIHVIDAVIDQEENTLTVWDVVVNSDDHNTLETAIQLAGLEDVYNLNDPVTLFAPTDNAFNMLPIETLNALLADPQGDLRTLLLSHSVNNIVRGADLTDGQSIIMADGTEVLVTVNNGDIFINDAQVIIADIVADNGIVHVIDAVIMPPVQRNTVYDIIVNNDEYSILEDAINAAGLDIQLIEDASVTFFAPNNDAFNALPQDVLDDLLADPMGMLREILLFHQFNFNLPTASMFSGLQIIMANGEQTTITNSPAGLFINESLIINGDIMADNGFVHEVNAIIQPIEITTSVYDVISSEEELSIFKTAVDASGLDQELTESALVTVFAPSDQAFDALPPGVLDELLSDPNGLLRDLVNYHIYEGLLLSNFLTDGLDISMANGATVTVTEQPDGIYIHNARVIIQDLQADNGVVHVLDAVIMAPDERNTVYDVIANNTNLNTLTSAIDAAGLDQDLIDADGITVFAPTDLAFDFLPDGVLDAFLSDPMGDLRTVLFNHTFNGELMSSDLDDGRLLIMQGGLAATISIRSEGLFINNAQIVLENVLADNGIVHIIDAVIEEEEEEDPVTIYDIVSDRSDLSVLKSAVDLAGLDGNLTNDQDITLFAPTDQAFSALPTQMLDELLADPSGILRDLLLDHVLGRELRSTDMTDQQLLIMSNGLLARIFIDQGSIIINEAMITVTDLEADNGVVHLLGAVLMPLPPPNTIYDVISNSTDLSVLKSAIDLAGLDEFLQMEEDLTFFAPTNAAFDLLPAGDLDALLADPEGALKDVLQDHIYDRVRMSSGLLEGLRLTMLNGLEVTFFEEPDGIYINDALISDFDIAADNGIVHVVDRLVMEMMPSSSSDLQDSDMRVYPNPVTDFVTVCMDEIPVSQSHVLRVYDMDGRLVLKERIKADCTEINLSHWMNGVYKLVIGDKHPLTRSIIKL